MATGERVGAATGPAWRRCVIDEAHVAEGTDVMRSVHELVCPGCGGRLVLDQAEPGSGPSVLRCDGCPASYPIVDGVPHFAVDPEEDTGARSFGFAWRRFWEGGFDRESVFGLKTAETLAYVLRSFGIEKSALVGRRFLDAGTGSGRILMALQDCQCRLYGVDIHQSLPLVRRHLASDLGRLCQADVLALPFPDAFFDFVWSSGVIHHTRDSATAFAALARKVKPGGYMFVSVYGKAFHHYRLLRRLLPFTRYVPAGANYLLARVLAGPLYVAFNGALFVVRAVQGGKGPPFRVLGYQIEDIEPKSYRSIALNVFDQLHPRIQREHSVEEVLAWFAAGEFEEVVPTNVVGMVEVRGVRRK